MSDDSKSAMGNDDGSTTGGVYPELREALTFRRERVAPSIAFRSPSDKAWIAQTMEIYGAFTPWGCLLDSASALRCCGVSGSSGLAYDRSLLSHRVRHPLLPQ